MFVHVPVFTSTHVTVNVCINLCAYVFVWACVHFDMHTFVCVSVRICAFKCERMYMTVNVWM